MRLSYESDTDWWIGLLISLQIGRSALKKKKKSTLTSSHCLAPNHFKLSNQSVFQQRASRSQLFLWWSHLLSPSGQHEKDELCSDPKPWLKFPLQEKISHCHLAIWFKLKGAPDWNSPAGCLLIDIFLKGKKGVWWSLNVQLLGYREGIIEIQK